jgi:hypothetical protein
MAARVWASVAVLWAAVSAQAALAQDQPPELTPAGKAMLKGLLAAPVRFMSGAYLVASTKPTVSPRPVCMFRGGLCGAVNRDGTVAVPPRYDWVGEFFGGRAAVRVGGLYGFVDESGREIVKPKYRIVDDYQFGFAQVDVDGKSGLIDRDGKMVIAPKYGSIEAIAPDRFRVSDERRLRGRAGSEDLSSFPIQSTDGNPTITIYDGRVILYESWSEGGVIDISGRAIERPNGAIRGFNNKDDPSIRWVERDKLWGLARTDGTWLIEPKFQYVDALSDGLARVTLDGKVGFVDRIGHFAIEPAFDKAQSFVPGLGRTSATRGDVLGVIDKTGAWVFQTSYEALEFARILGSYSTAESAVGWHFKKSGRWGLLNLDGRIVVDADFDVPVQVCAYGGFLASKNKEWLRIKKDGSPLQPANGLVIAGCNSRPPYTLSVNGKFGLIDAEGHSVTPLHFEAITWTGAQFRNVKLGGKWGRIALDGRWLIEPKFDYLSNDVDLLVAAVDGKRGFMRADGTWLIEPKFDAARIRNAETAFVTISGATGLMRLKDQSWIILPRPGTLCDIYRGGFLSRGEGKRAFLSPEGETWIDIDADRIGLALDLGLLVFLRNGKWGLVDTAGQVMVEPQYDDLRFFDRGIAWAKSGDRWCAIDRRGKTVPHIGCADADPTGLNGGGTIPCAVED